MTNIAELLLCYEEEAEARGGNLPLVVNTHGWVRDLGFDLLRQMVGLMLRGVLGRPQRTMGGTAMTTRQFFVMQIEMHAQARNLPRRRWWADDGNALHANGVDADGGRCDAVETHVIIRPVRSVHSEAEMNDAYNSADARLWHYDAFARDCENQRFANGHAGIGENTSGVRCATTTGKGDSRGALAHRLASVPPYCIAASDIKVPNENTHPFRHIATIMSDFVLQPRARACVARR